MVDNVIFEASIFAFRQVCKQITAKGTTTKAQLELIKY